MNKSIIIAAVAVAAACAFAQEADKPECGQKGKPQKPHMQAFMPNAGMWIPKMFSDKGIFEKIGLTDEAAVEKISADLAALESRGCDIEGKIRELSREQSKLFMKLLKDGDADQKQVMDIIDEIAKLRAEQGRISVEAIMVLRSGLTQEQMEKALELVRERGGERHRMRMGPGHGDRPFPPPKEMRDGQRGPEGKGPKGPWKQRGDKKGKRHMHGGDAPEGDDAPPPEAPEAGEGDSAE